MVIFTVYTELRIIARFTVMIDFCATCTCRSTTGSICMTITLAFKAIERIRDIRSDMTI